MRSARHISTKLTRPSLLAHLRRHLSTNSNTRPVRTSKSMPDRTLFFSQSLRHSSQPQSALTRLLTRTYHGGPDPGASSAAVRSSVWIIIGLNAAVFGTWQYAETYNDQKLKRQLYENFTLSDHNLKAGRYWTVITSAFSHKDTTHFIFNMFALNAFGSIMAIIPGVRGVHVWTLAIGSGIAGSLGWLWHRQSLAERKQDKKNWWDGFKPSGRRVITIDSALGASGIAMGMGATATMLWPTAPMRVMMALPAPLWAITLGYFAIDAYFLDNQNTGIGHSAHLAGAIYGAVYYLAYLRGSGGIWHMLRFRR